MTGQATPADLLGKSAYQSRFTDARFPFYNQHLPLPRSYLV